MGRVLTMDEEIIAAARTLQQKGARNVLVSMAGDGALLVDENGEVHRIGCPKGKVVNSVGAGDSMVAGLWLAGCRPGAIPLHCVWAQPAAVQRRSALALPPKKKIRRTDEGNLTLCDGEGCSYTGREKNHAYYGIIHRAVHRTG